MSSACIPEDADPAWDAELPRRASCRAAGPWGCRRLLGVFQELVLVSLGNCWRHIDTVAPADVGRSGIANDEILLARNDVELQGGHAQSSLTLVFRNGLDPGGDRIDGTVAVDWKRCAILPMRNLRVLVDRAVVVDVGMVAVH